jgi:hypothetical protein
VILLHFHLVLFISFERKKTKEVALKFFIAFESIGKPKSDCILVSGWSIFELAF